MPNGAAVGGVLPAGGEEVMLPAGRAWWEYQVLKERDEVVQQMGNYITPMLAELLYTSAFEGDILRKYIDSTLSNPSYLGGKDDWPPIKETDFWYWLLGPFAFFIGVYDGLSGRFIEREIEKRKKELGIPSYEELFATWEVKNFAAQGGEGEEREGGEEERREDRGRQYQPFPPFGLPQIPPYFPPYLPYPMPLVINNGEINTNIIYGGENNHIEGNRENTTTSPYNNSIYGPPSSYGLPPYGLRSKGKEEKKENNHPHRGVPPDTDPSIW